jgi:HK97 family phage major capsid protein
VDHITELRGRIATLQHRRAELGQQSAGYAARSELTAEDRTAWDQVRTQITELDGDVARLNSAIEQEEEGLRQAARTPAPVITGGNGATPPGSNPEPRQNASGMELRTVRMRALGQAHDERGVRTFRDTPIYSDPAARGWFNELRSRSVANADYEFRAFQADSPTEGGYLSRGEQFVADLIQAVDDRVFIRQLATVMQVPDGNTSLGRPSLDTDAEDWDWTTELDTGNEEDTLRFGKRVLEPHPLAKLVKISRELLRAAAMPAENIVLARMAYKLGTTQENAFLTGTGAGRPLGVFVASNDGISTGRDVSTGNEATSITFDGLQEAKYTLKAAYWPRARWMFHRTGVKQIAKLKDGEGRYMWEPSVQAGQPDRLLALPMDVSEFCPSTFTSGQYVGILADWTYYHIADSLAMQMQRLVELYARTNQIGFIGRIQTDGMPVLEEAFVRVKLG